jgi:hypothetical protein
MAMTNITHDGEFRDPFPGIEARPLQLPDFVNVKPKNPGVSFRWVNRSVGLKESTQRLDEMVFAGFVPVRPDEALVPDLKGGFKPIPPNLIKDGKIIRGDLILMKIDKVAYEGALKYNWERSVSRLHPDRQLQTGKKQLASAISKVGVPPSVGRTLASKLQAFRPGSSDKPADPTFMAEDDALPSERKED